MTGAVFFCSLAMDEVKSTTFIRSLTAFGMTTALIFTKPAGENPYDCICFYYGGCCDGCARREVKVRIVEMVVDGLLFKTDCCHSERSEEANVFWIAWIGSLEHSGCQTLLFLGPSLRSG